MSTAIVPGSLAAIATQSNKSLAESFLSADVVVLIDVSGSMEAIDGKPWRSFETEKNTPTRTRYDIACAELAKLQASLPGKIAIVAFSDLPEFTPGGTPRLIGNGTMLSMALQFVQPADGTVRFIVISDGLPNDPGEALKVAATFTSRIDTIYIGPDDDYGGGKTFLQRLATAHQGQYVTVGADLLSSQVKTLLLTGA